MGRTKSTSPKKKSGTGRLSAKKQGTETKGVEDLQSVGENEKFVNDLLVRNEAAEPGEDGKVPLMATHVIEKKNPDGSVQVKRIRFKLY